MLFPGATLGSASWSRRTLVRRHVHRASLETTGPPAIPGRSRADVHVDGPSRVCVNDDLFWVPRAILVCPEPRSANVNETGPAGILGDPIGNEPVLNNDLDVHQGLRWQSWNGRRADVGDRSEE